MNKMIEQIKEIHKDAVCLYKVGSFYHAYGRDTCVMSYLFDYKIKEWWYNKKISKSGRNNLWKLKRGEYIGGCSFQKDTANQNDKWS